jgi:curved DNA-binding protein
MMNHDFYAILGVSEQASDAEIRRVYRLRVRQYHPDLNPEIPQATELLQQVNAAGAVLGNPERRRAYDNARMREKQRLQFSEFDVTGAQGYAVEYPISITPTEAQYGTQHNVRFHDRYGNPVVVEVLIPADTASGAVLRLAGQGGPNRAGTQRGDLVVRITIGGEFTHADASADATALRPARNGLAGWIAALFGNR